ncbi:oxidoreductase [Aliifodinibius salipaludis]|uniref:Oxidoreductase n=1 Tax=Fodinibius salipaludis TaxID=2032627 RepID=A0A2A2G793_9BACT|nr:NAD-dependent epimerase/dehydratase family protein [Aliifodinibius salipaludis]PAU92732.1 oxidoreductase [Aliifodinibius salipaludis]
MTKNAFVTGGTGFIGINLVKQLVEQGWDVTALHRSTSDLSTLKQLPVNLAEGSITDLTSLQEVMSSDIEVVFHLAGDTNMWSQNNARQTEVNVTGTKNMVRVSSQKNVETFIHTSSVSAWGAMDGKVTEESPQQGGESWVNYERTKWLSEREALKARNHDTKVVIMNPAMVVGPHDANNWGRLFFALRDDDLPGVTHGNMSVAHVEEVAKAHISAVDQGNDGERYILGGRKCTFAEFVSIITEVSNISAEPKIIPASILKIVAYFQAGISYLTENKPDLTPELAKLMTRNVVYSSDKAKKELGYSIPPVKKSVKDCYEWLVKEELL